MSLIALAALALGCQEGVKIGKQFVALDAVPPAVLAAAQKTRPEVKFDRVYKAGDIYEVQGKNKAGKVIEVEVNEAGDVVQIEE